MVDDDSSMFFAVPLSCKASSRHLWPAWVKLPRVRGVGEKFVDTALVVRGSDHPWNTVNGTMVLNMCSSIERETMRMLLYLMVHNTAGSYHTPSSLNTMLAS